METHLYFWGEKHREEKRKKCLQAKERQGCISRKTVNRSKDTLTMMNFIFGKKRRKTTKTRSQRIFLCYDFANYTGYSLLHAYMLWINMCVYQRKKRSRGQDKHILSSQREEDVMITEKEK